MRWAFAGIIFSAGIVAVLVLREGSRDDIGMLLFSLATVCFFSGMPLWLAKRRHRPTSKLGNSEVVRLDARGVPMTNEFAQGSESTPASSNPSPR